jgi:hypothetical protein
MVTGYTTEMIAGGERGDGCPGWKSWVDNSDPRQESQPGGSVFRPTRIGNGPDDLQVETASPWTPFWLSALEWLATAPVWGHSTRTQRGKHQERQGGWFRDDCFRRGCEQ